jgi:hypothetical protein
MARPTGHIMLQNIKQLYGSRLAALDGDFGHAKDFYFDDKAWVIRYLVADTGSWLTGRLVLLSPHAFGKWDLYEKALHIKLQKKQIEESPSIATHEPVSLQFEENYYRSYGWPAYWQGGQMWGMSGYPLVAAPLPQDLGTRRAMEPRADRNLQSAKAVTGYSVEATDGMVGHLGGFIVDDRSWAVSNLVVETGHWFSGRDVMILPQMVERFSPAESKMYVNLTKAEIQSAAESELAGSGAGDRQKGNFSD